MGGGTPFWSAHWVLFASRSLVARWGQNAILVCALDVACFADCCCSVVAERHFSLRTGHYSLRGLLLPGGGISPFWSAHWTLLASQSLVARLWHTAISFCTLEVICFAVCCCSVVAERLFHSAPWTFFASQSLATRQSGARPVCMNNKRLVKAGNI